MNTQPAYAPPNAEPHTPDLPDLLNLLERLGKVPYHGTEYRQILASIGLMASFVPQMSGVVVDGEVYDTPPTSARDAELHSALAAANRRGALDPEMWGAYVAWIEAAK